MIQSETEVQVYTEQEWQQWQPAPWGELMHRPASAPAPTGGPITYQDNRRVIVVNITTPEPMPQAAPIPARSLWDEIEARPWPRHPSTGPCTPARFRTTLGKRLQRRAPETVAVLKSIPADARFSDLTPRQERAYRQYQLEAMDPPTAY